jgi:hypothetical protein
MSPLANRPNDTNVTRRRRWRMTTIRLGGGDGRWWSSMMVSDSFSPLVFVLMTIPPFLRTSCKVGGFILVPFVLFIMHTVPLPLPGFILI